MKTMELTGILGHAVTESGRRPLSEAEQRLYAAICAALTARSEWYRSQSETCMQMELLRVDPVFRVSRFRNVSTEWLIKMVRWTLRVLDKKPMNEGEQILLTGLHLAVMAYEDEVRWGHPAAERRCMICEVPLSQCCC
jgi:hypothetical protein